MLQMARATQRMYYPEFLPDATRPLGLPGSSAGDRSRAISESFGTLRYGRLAEVLLYDRAPDDDAGRAERGISRRGGREAGSRRGWRPPRSRTSSMCRRIRRAGPPANGANGTRTCSGRDRKLTIKVAKPYWQSGWLKQHDRLMAAMSAMTAGAFRWSISGDLHAVGMARMLRSGTLDMKANPINVVLSGPVGSRPGPEGWPSGRRGTGAMPSAHVELDEQVKPIEQHSFTIVDFTPDKMTVRLFKWDIKTEPVSAIDTLQPFHTAELPRPA